MAKGINKVILIGNLGRDPETRFTAEGTAITNITVATSESWKDKNTGEKTERTEWHRVVMFGKLAEIASEYLKKGSQVYLEGKLKTDKFKGKDGTDKYSTNVVCSELQILSSLSRGDSSPHSETRTPDHALDNSIVDDDIPF